jgi:hypothetical protein
MSIAGLIRRLVKGSPLTAAEHDTNLDLLEAAIEEGVGDQVTSVAGKTGDVSLEAGDIQGFDASVEEVVAGMGELGAVDSVNGRTGAVVLTKTDVDLSQVDDTSDADKPISTATQTALDGKSATGHSHALLDSATTLATPNTLPLRDANGGGTRYATTSGVGAYFVATTGIAGSFYSESGFSVEAYTATGTAIVGATTGAGTGGWFASASGTYHARFGDTGSDRSFVARLKGAFGWFRGAFTGRIVAADTLTADRVWTLPDGEGTLSLNTHGHGNITAAGAIGATAGRIPYTGASGVLEVSSDLRLTSGTGSESGLGLFAAYGRIQTWGFEGYIQTNGVNGRIGTLGENGHIFTDHVTAFIQSRGGFRLIDTSNRVTILTHAPTDNRTISFPDASGTVALTSDIPTEAADIGAAADDHDHGWLNNDGTTTLSPDGLMAVSSGGVGTYQISYGLEVLTSTLVVKADPAGAIGVAAAGVGVYTDGVSIGINYNAIGVILYSGASGLAVGTSPAGLYINCASDGGLEISGVDALQVKADPAGAVGTSSGGLTVYTDDVTIVKSPGNTLQIANGGVGASQIANDAVTTDKIADNAVTDAKVSRRVRNTARLFMHANFR